MRLSILSLTALLTLTIAACADDPAADSGSNDATSSTLASATIDCKTTKPFYENKVHGFKFTIGGLDKTDDDAIVWLGDSLKADEDESLDTDPITVTPKGSPLYELNENYSLSYDKGNLRLFGDGDGFIFITAVLYRDSGFRSGYVQMKDGGGGMGDAYSTVSCTVTDAGPKEAGKRPKRDDTKKNAEKAQCGGIAGLMCPEGLKCMMPPLGGFDLMGVCQ